MNEISIENKIESVIFSTNIVEIDKLCDVLVLDKDKIIEHIENLKLRYKDTSLEILVINDSVQICTKKEYCEIIKKFVISKKNSPLSNAALEVLAIIAYNQPVTKGFVEKVRGVDSSSIVNSLVNKELIAESGRMNLPGKPISYSVTDNFLRCFNLSSLKELPPIESFEQLLSQNKMDDVAMDNQLTL